MARQEWIEAAAAAKILSENSGKNVSTDYLRVLAKKGYLSTEKKDGRSKLYLKSEVQAYTVGQRGRKSKQEVSKV